MFSFMFWDPLPCQGDLLLGFLFIFLLFSLGHKLFLSVCVFILLSGCFFVVFISLPGFLILLDIAGTLPQQFPTLFLFFFVLNSFISFCLNTCCLLLVFSEGLFPVYLFYFCFFSIEYPILCCYILLLSIFLFGFWLVSEQVSDVWFLFLCWWSSLLFFFK